MRSSERGHARRAEVTEPTPIAELGGDADYSGAFEVVAPHASPQSAEQWARTTFEDAPAALRWFLIVGWRAVLRLRLASGRLPDQVFGWKIISASQDADFLVARSPLITAHKVLRVDGPRVTVATSAHYTRRFARAVWSTVAPIHHLTESYLLGRASRHQFSRSGRWGTIRS